MFSKSSYLCVPYTVLYLRLLFEPLSSRYCANNSGASPQQALGKSANGGFLNSLFSCAISMPWRNRDDSYLIFLISITAPHHSLFVFTASQISPILQSKYSHILRRMDKATSSLRRSLVIVPVAIFKSLRSVTLAISFSASLIHSFL